VTSQSIAKVGEIDASGTKNVVKSSRNINAGLKPSMDYAEVPNPWVVSHEGIYSSEG
jgi:hypothetical protein